MILIIVRYHFPYILCPIQPELPIWLTVAGNPESFRQAGHMGVNVLTHILGQSIEELANKIKIYKEALISANHSITEKTITLMIHSFVSHSEEYSRQYVKEPFKNYLRTSIDLIKQVYTGDDLDKLTSDEMDSVLENAFERYYSTNGLFGTVASCQTLITKLKEIGVTEVACLIDFGIADNIVLENLHYLNELRISSNSSDLETYSWNNIADLIERHEVTHLQCTPSLAQLIFESAQPKKLKSLATLMIGGEVVNWPLVHKLKQNTSAKIYNMYGPTETTIWSSFALIQDKLIIGKPLSNQRMYVLDGNLIPLPPGLVGELYIGGDGLARGYLNQSELTKDRFIDNPFQAGTNKYQNKNDRLYKTGDLVRYLPDGNIEYVGRNDFQVKIKGVRVELSDIEANLLAYPEIREAVVIAKNYSDKHSSAQNNYYLIAYYVAANKLDKSMIYSYLETRIPQYMIPSMFVHLNELPLTKNGKVNRQALPHLEPHTEDKYCPPRNELEAKMCEIYASILKLEPRQVGIHDDFFRLGGDSVVSIQLVSQLRKQLDLDLKISVRDVFRYRNIRDLFDNVISKLSVIESEILSEQCALDREIADEKDSVVM